MCAPGVQSGGSWQSVTEKYILQPLSIFYADRRRKPPTRVTEVMNGPQEGKTNCDSFKLGVCPIKSFSEPAYKSIRDGLKNPPHR